MWCHIQVSDHVTMCHSDQLLCPRSRQQWYGNTDPEYQGVVHTEIAHVWPGVGNDSQILYTSESFTQVSQESLVWSGLTAIMFENSLNSCVNTKQLKESNI